MAVPKRRKSKSRKRTSRSNWKATPISLSKCSNCGSLIKPHNVCPFCGYYKGKQVIQIKVKESKKEK